MCCGREGMSPGFNHRRGFNYPMPLISVEEEVKELEEYKEALQNQLERVNKRLQDLKR